MDELQGIVDEFLVESDELLDSVQTDIMALEEARDVETINRVYRAFHSLKGNALMLGFDRLGAFAHRAEDVLSLIRGGECAPGREVADALLGAVDTMKLTLDDLRNGGDDSRSSQSAALRLESLLPAHTRSAPQPAAALEADCEVERDVEPERPRPGVVLDLGAPPSQEPAPAPVEEIEPAARAARPRTGIPAQRQREEGALRFLVVEDDFTSRQMLIAFLSQYGECHAAKDGLEAIHAFSQSYEQDPPQPYDLICMDIVMPGMQGTLASKTLREIERGKGVEGTEQESIIVMTSAVQDTATIIRACYECGANYYFVKPLDFAQMERQMRKFQLIE